MPELSSIQWTAHAVRRFVSRCAPGMSLPDAWSYLRCLRARITPMGHKLRRGEPWFLDAPPCVLVLVRDYDVYTCVTVLDLSLLEDWQNPPPEVDLPPPASEPPVLTSTSPRVRLPSWADPSKHPRSALDERARMTGESPPDFTFEARGREGAQTFLCTCRMAGVRRTAMGLSKREARAEAARLVVDALRAGTGNRAHLPTMLGSSV